MARSRVVKVYFLDQIGGKAAVGSWRRADGAVVEDETFALSHFQTPFRMLF
jgi:hypothetical protein